MESGALGNYSSAGCSVTAESTATLMYWSCNFGAFRGLGGLPAGRVELRAEQNVSGLESPSSLAYNHPLNSRLDVPEGGIAPEVRFNLVQGDRVIAMRCYTDGSVLPIGVDTSGGGRAALDTVEKRKGKTFISVEEFANTCSKLSKTHIEQLKSLGAFAGMADTSQVSLF